MITYIVGDLFSSPAQVLVNTVNTVGVMGKGIALTFRKVYPEMYDEYRCRCRSGQLDIGSFYLYKASNKWILNFPTKKHWRARSKIQYIEKGLQKFVEAYETEGIKSISFPMLGCQHGGLDWEDVQPVMERYLADLPADIHIYIHLYRPDLLPFPKYRNTKALKAQLIGDVDYPDFEDFWQGIRSHFFKKQAETLWEQLKDGQYVRLGDLPESIQPIGNAEGCVYVQKVERERYLIGHRSDRKQRVSDKYVEVIPGNDFKTVEQELHDMFVAHKVPGTRKQFNLDDSQIVEIKSYANQLRIKKINLFVKALPQNIFSIRHVLLSEDPDPTFDDIGLHIIPAQVKSQAKQRKLL